MRHLRTALIAFSLLTLPCLAGTSLVTGTPPQDPAAGPAARTTGNLEGTVTDSSGATVAGATVTVHDASGATKTAVTDNSGKFRIAGLSAGAADAAITQTTFADYKSEALTITAGDTETLVVQMAPLVKATDVLVQSERASGIQTDNGVVSTTLNEARVQAIPLNGRVFLGLLTIAPGVSNQTGQDEAKVGVVGSAKFAVNGGRTEYNSFLVDGSDVLNTDVAASHGASSLMVYPSIDSIKELKVLTSNYGAEYGRSASGTVLVTTKSGLTKVHGSAYEFIRNEFFNSRNYFDIAAKAPLYRRQDFGGTVGGPLFLPHVFNTNKDKSFFFLSDEFRKESSPQQFNHGVPSDAERGYNTLTGSYGTVADFSDACPANQGGATFDPAQYPDCPPSGGTSAFQNNQFPINPTSAAFLQTGLIPRANSTTGCTSTIGSCYNATVSPPTDFREDLVRLDQTLPLRTNLSLTVIHDHWTAVVPIPQWPNNINSFPTVENKFVGPGFSAIGHLTTLLPYSFLSDFSYGFTRQRITLSDVAGPGASLNRAPIDAIKPAVGSVFPYAGGKIPGIVIAGTNPAYGGTGFNADTSFEPWSHFLSTQTFRESVTKFAGRHTLLFGVQFVNATRNEVSAANGSNTGNLQGVLTFGSSASIGNAFADFLIGNQGRIVSYQQDSAQLPYKVTYQTIEPYLQDDWKVTSRLTLNLGLRMSLFYNWKPEGKALYNWVQGAFDPKLLSGSNVIVNPGQGYFQSADNIAPVPPSTTGLYPYQTNGLVQCGVNGIDSSCQTTHLVNPAPRLGLAWDPLGRGTTSIRAGYGVFFEHGTGSEANAGSLIGNPPRILSIQQSFPQSYQDIGHPGPGRTESLTFPLNMVSIPAKTVWPYVQQWSFGVQQEVTKDTAIGLSYVGSKGTHLATQFQINQLPAVSAADNLFGPHQPITPGICRAVVNAQGNPVNIGPGVTLDAKKNPATAAALNVACDGTPADPSNGNFTSIQFDLNSVRPFQGVGRVQAIRDVASSVYHSAQLTMRTTHGPMDVQISYTFSHSIDSASDRYESTFVNSFDLAANRASSSFDQRQLFNLSYVYQLPLLRLIQNLRNTVDCSETAAANGDLNCPTSAVAPPYSGPSKWTRMLAGGWSLSGITLFTTGTPFSVVNGGSPNGGEQDNAGLALGNGADSYADIARGGPPCMKTLTTASGTFGPLLGNPCQFVVPRGLTQGNSGRNYFRNPRRTNFDLAALKEFKTWHESTVQFRAEAFNIFNNTQFILYDPNKGNTGSNTVSCYGDSFSNYSAGAYNCQAGNSLFRPVSAHRPRTLQFGLKLEF